MTDRVEKDSIGTRHRFARRLAEAGYQDVYVISKDHAGRVTRPDTQSILDALQARDEPVTINALAQLTDRDDADVRDEVEYLTDLGIIDRTSDGIELGHNHVVIEPVVTTGE